MLAISSDDAGGKEENMEAFLLEMASDLIGSTEQTRGDRGGGGVGVGVVVVRSRSRRRSSILKIT